ncbi:hypothetical protein [Tardiphaga sp.]|uniref:hypothetical protein n=1 Tax=Tardiphaga sp. TaxID=1926292 RepID=UPI0019C2C927|nr:hypothetical protein [Tardiphaga sp.]MBC7580920.1 hypothetical protein [Tardiphaga sp.]
MVNRLNFNVFAWSLVASYTTPDSVIGKKAVKRLSCLGCFSPIRRVDVMPSGPGFDTHTFECVACSTISRVTLDTRFATDYFSIHGEPWSASIRAAIPLGHDVKLERTAGNDNQIENATLYRPSLNDRKRGAEMAVAVLALTMLAASLPYILT